MKSVYAKTLLWAFTILIISLGGFLYISRNLVYNNFDNDGPVRRNALLQFHDARAAYERGGKHGLATYLKSQRTAYPNLEILYLDQGVDLLTGIDRSGDLRKASSFGRFINVFGQLVTAIPSANSSQILLITRPAPDLGVYAPYYLLIMGAVGVMCWVMTLQFVSPLHVLRQAVTRFGDGDLTARVHSRRGDEIGEVSRAFDEMAGRIEHLVGADQRLLQDIAHELRSPLARLGFAIELIRTSSDQNGSIARANKEVNRLTSLVSSLLEVTRIEVDPQSCKLVRIDLAVFINEIVHDCSVEADAVGCHLRMSGLQAVDLEAEPELLRRAIENVVRNAIRHSPRNTTVDISTAANDNGTITVSIRDYGMGVPAGELDNIFRPFYRVDSSRVERTGGVGLGLSIVQRAVQIHHGRVWAENVEPGLRVVMELPFHPTLGTAFEPAAHAANSR